MSLRLRLALAFVALTTAATVAVGAWACATTMDQLYADIDRSLNDIAAISRDAGTRPGDVVSPRQDVDADGPPGASTFWTQVLDGSGVAVRSEAVLSIPIEAPDLALAAGADRTASAARDV